MRTHRPSPLVRERPTHFAREPHSDVGPWSSEQLAQSRVRADLAAGQLCWCASWLGPEALHELWLTAFSMVRTCCRRVRRQHNREGGETAHTWESQESQEADHEASCPDRDAQPLGSDTARRAHAPPREAAAPRRGPAPRPHPSTPGVEDGQPGRRQHRRRYTYHTIYREPCTNANADAGRAQQHGRADGAPHDGDADARPGDQHGSAAAGRHPATMCAPVSYPSSAPFCKSAIERPRQVAIVTVDRVAALRFQGTARLRHMFLRGGTPQQLLCSRVAMR